MADQRGIGKVALVTGASGEIGAAIAEALGREGVSVVVHYHRDRSQALKVARSIRLSGSETIALQADVAKESEVVRLVARTYNRFGRIDFLVNNAGINRDNLIPFLPPADWDSVLATNLRGAFLCTREVLGNREYRRMAHRRFGRIVNVTSVVGVIGNAGQANYAAAKAGLIGLTKSAALENAKRGITVNAVAPGYIPSPMWDNVSESMKDQILAMIPIGRPGTSVEVAGVVAFLLLDPAAAYITGQVLHVDGGMVMA